MMKKEYSTPLIEVSDAEMKINICDVSGHDGGGSGTGEGEEELTKHRGSQNANDGWGNLW
jgi:hypothetical protein